MTIHYEMTNAELAGIVQNAGIDESFYAEAAKRLRAMPEPPKPEFGVGWKGKNYNGTPVEIYAIKKNRLIGAYFNDNGGYKDCWTPQYWNLDGSHTGVVVSNGPSLKPNTPKPEIYWRVKGRKFGTMFVSSRDVKVTHPNSETEKVEVLVVK